MNRKTRTGLLVSVRNAAEAIEALAGGADIIDVKDPLRGSLGAAPAAVIAKVVASVAGRRPVSAAMGELREYAAIEPPAGLSWIKFGLAGFGSSSEWQERLLSMRDQNGSTPGVVAVAYADWQRAAAPPTSHVAAFVCRHRLAALLIDTFVKDEKMLLDWIPVSALADLCHTMKVGNVPVALAGSLGLEQIERLLPLAPEWFAVRGSACRGGRGGQVCSQQVRQLADLIQGEPLCVVP